MNFASFCLPICRFARMRRGTARHLDLIVEANRHFN
jgi:hypothetical protein